MLWAQDDMQRLASGRQLDKVTWACSQEGSSWGPFQQRAATQSSGQEGDLSPQQLFPLPLVLHLQISADKKTLGRFCGQLGSPLGNPPEAREFISQGNKMLLTFHTDFSNEENGTVMFYKGFLAYYQAVGEWPQGPFLLAQVILNGDQKRGTLSPKKQKAKPSRLFPSRELFPEEACQPGFSPHWEVPRKH